MLGYQPFPCPLRPKSPKTAQRVPEQALGGGRALPG